MAILEIPLILRDSSRANLLLAQNEYRLIIQEVRKNKMD
jgi:hypothetical protein